MIHHTRCIEGFHLLLFSRGTLGVELHHRGLGTNSTFKVVQNSLTKCCLCHFLIKNRINIKGLPWGFLRSIEERLPSKVSHCWYAGKSTNQIQEVFVRTITIRIGSKYHKLQGLDLLFEIRGFHITECLDNISWSIDYK